MFKRGISPLIATVLIIGFTVALGAVIMIWGGDFVKSIQSGVEVTEQKASSCAAASLSAENVEQTKPGEINFLLENLGQQDVKSVIVRLTGPQGTDSTTKPGLTIAGKKAYSVEFDPEKTGIPLTQLEFIPTLDLNNEPNPCAPGVVVESETPAEEVQVWDTSCPNGIVEEFEECEGTVPAEITCQTLGYAEGTLACSDSCSIDTSACTGISGPATCGNDLLDTGEVCDIDSFGLPLYPIGSSTCAEVTPGTEGELSCYEGCALDTTQCAAPVGPTTCGNALLDSGEVCDGTLPGTETCITQGFASGTLACQPDCLTYNTTACIAAPAQTCGNSLIEGTEVCDGSSLSGQTCATQPGFRYGTISCKQDCTAYNTTNCFMPLNIKSGFTQTCLLTTLGDVYCWGRNNYGQLGDGTNIDSLVPKKSQMTAATLMAVGGYHTCAVNTTGTYCWGYNFNGQIGDGTSGVSANKNVPIKINTISGVTQLTAGGSVTCALNASGMYCWGSNFYQSLGVGDSIDRAIPTPVVKQPGALGVPKQISAGGDHTCAVTAADNMYCWGRNDKGELGVGAVDRAWRNIPTLVSLISGVTQIAPGGSNTCAVGTAGGVLGMYCWGWNAYGQLGVAILGIADAGLPMKTLMTNPTQIIAGSGHTCAINTTGMYCWGAGSSGQLGNGSTVLINPFPTKNFMTNPSLITAGDWRTCALNTTGMYCWGQNTYGQLGDTTTTPRNTPTPIVA